MEEICEDCAVVETLQKEQDRIEKYKDEIQAIRVKNRQLQAELAAKDQEFDDLHGWLTDRIIEYGKFKDGDKIIERICIVAEEYAERKSKEKTSPAVLELRRYIKQLQAENAELKKKKDNIFEIYIPNLRADEVQYIRGEINRFTKDLLNKLTEHRKHRN